MCVSTAPSESAAECDSLVITVTGTGYWIYMKCTQTTHLSIQCASGRTHVLNKCLTQRRAHTQTRTHTAECEFPLSPPWVQRCLLAHQLGSWNTELLSRKGTVKWEGGITRMPDRFLSSLTDPRQRGSNWGAGLCKIRRQKSHFRPRLLWTSDAEVWSASRCDLPSEPTTSARSSVRVVLTAD